MHPDEAEVIARNSIIAGNTAQSHPNLWEAPGEGSYGNLTSGDPLLSPLGDYEGLTMTMPPLQNSPAIDAGGNTLLTEDQRGRVRIVNGVIDIGAVEFQSVADEVFFPLSWIQIGMESKTGSNLRRGEILFFLRSDLLAISPCIILVEV